jgi:Icc-related predicted phosphoesterase
MRLLVLADEESKYLWDYFDKSKLEGIDLILSCGDLSPHYLSFLATFAKVPILYVHGNHDGCYKETPPEGCICIDGEIFVYQGVRILGLGGCMKYDGSEPLQFTEKEMEHRVKKMKLKLMKNKGFDVLLTHSPAYKINDANDLPHTGFKSFVDLLDKYQPELFIHGHVHMNYGREIKRETVYNSTRIVNAFERYIIEI